MSENTKIEWTATTGPDGTVYPGYTYNPWWGCMKVSEACKFCYAEGLDNRYHGGEHWGPKAKYKVPSEATLNAPLKWNRKAEKLGVRLKVFSLSMGDWLDPAAPLEGLAWLFRMIHATPNLDWLLLTKRPENFEQQLEKFIDASIFDPSVDRSVCRQVLEWWAGGNPPPNVWVGTTVENQARADERIPALLSIPARVRFLSCEPLLGPVYLPETRTGHEPFDALGSYGAWGIDWVIAGGESGHGARPSHPEWFRSLRDQCEEAGVPYFFKQWGEWVDECHSSAKEYPNDKLNSVFVTMVGAQGNKVESASEAADYRGPYMARVGKKAAGRLLDGVEHNGMPEGVDHEH